MAAIQASMLLPGPPEPAPASGMGSAAGGAQCGEGEEWEGGWIATEAACTMASIGSSQDVLPGSLESNGPRVRAAHISDFRTHFRAALQLTAAGALAEARTAQRAGSILLAVEPRATSTCSIVFRNSKISN